MLLTTPYKVNITDAINNKTLRIIYVRVDCQSTIADTRTRPSATTGDRLDYPALDLSDAIVQTVSDVKIPVAIEGDVEWIGQGRSGGGTAITVKAAFTIPRNRCYDPIFCASLRIRWCSLSQI